MQTNDTKVESETTPAELWAVVEVMGHSRYAGRVSEYTGLGVPLVRVEIPAVGDRPAHEKLLGAASIFRVTPCTKEAALRAAASFHETPLACVGIYSQQPARLPFEDNGDDDDFDQ